MAMSARMRVLAAVAASYGLAFVPLLAFGQTGLWWVRLMVPVSLPLIAVACATAFLFANSIVRRPAGWSLAALGVAVAVSVVGLYFLSHSMIGVVSIGVAIPASAIFYLFARAWLRPKLATA